ncbi:PREDICTED: subtilisin-like protease SBT4.2 [Tarenaya hassleriana]|uniref:subtilisin-like protease SBT4.2 n=1 Tax=Tarenaya hassleriana TaxID=28532 RepID=UPI00053C100D|nr:PREDICTED: subtilisin-like protease SBT4.2 [Tarenaya hassleriana]
MGALPPNGDYSPSSHHQNILQQVIGTNSVGDSLVRSYGRSFNGFAAKLTEAERDKLSGMGGVVSVFESRDLKLQTTRSWDFMGFGGTFKRNPKTESDMVIGVIDTGIWPESPSFTDKGIGPPPKKWKGVCKGGSNFTCNNKIIGARYYVDSSARDNEGHGTHTASTAAGNEVQGVSFHGFAQGTARGGVPSARIAAYKVCESILCDDAAILAAFDDAIADGVDIISASLAGKPVSFDKSTISIGAFHAMEKGVLTVNSAGNDGPYPSSIASVAPWMLSVAASSTDREFATKVVLGNGTTLLGTSSINGFGMNNTKFSLAYGRTPASFCSEEEARMCEFRCLREAKGKIVVCDVINGEDVAADAGAVGLIVKEPDFPIISSSIPISALNDDDYKSLLAYINSTENPQGSILKSETIKDTSAPLVASFSSRGPNSIASDILKPDITAPGVNIIAAYLPYFKYYFSSGTSMSCPHVAGVAAYVKTVHPEWSASAIKSAIMTTAWAMNGSRNRGAEFAYGSGHLNPTKSADPGLVYDATKDDYVKMLCAMNYTTESVRIIAGNSSSCPKELNSNVRDLNYPSMASKVSTASPSEIVFSRTVTNVGWPNSTYKAEVTSDPKLKVTVEPESLVFGSVGEKKSFTVTVAHENLSDVKGPVSASLVWSDGSHVVRSPIVLYSSLPTDI